MAIRPGPRAPLDVPGAVCLARGGPRIPPVLARCLIGRAVRLAVSRDRSRKGVSCQNLDWVRGGEGGASDTAKDERKARCERATATKGISQCRAPCVEHNPVVCDPEDQAVGLPCLVWFFEGAVLLDPLVHLRLACVLDRQRRGRLTDQALPNVEPSATRLSDLAGRGLSRRGLRAEIASLHDAAQAARASPRVRRARSSTLTFRTPLRP